MLILSKKSKHLLHSTRASKSKQEQARASKSKQEQARASKSKQEQARASKSKQEQARASKSKQEQARASKSKQEPAMTYCVCEGNNKNIFMRKMKKNNFYKHITIGEDDDYYGGIKEVCDNIGIDYTDYDYLSDLV